MSCHLQFALVLMLAAANAAATPQVFRCVDEAGISIYQDHDCGADSERLENLAPIPVLEAQPENLAEEPKPRAPAKRRKSPRAGNAKSPEEPTAFRCTASDGQVFYRLDGCPRTVPVSRARGYRTQVRSEKVPRSTACREIERPSSVGRRGQRQDERISTYEKNLGRDPCG